MKQIEKEEKTENGEKKKESHARFIKCKKERRKGSPRVPSLPLKNHRCSRLRRSTSDFRVMYQTAYEREREREREGEERKENFYQVFQAVDRLYPLVRGPDHAQICRCPVMKVRFSDVRDIRRKPPR